MASIKQRDDGVWRARYRDDVGKEHARHFTRKRDAQRWLDEVATAVVTGQYVDPGAGKLTWLEWNHLWFERQTWVDGTVAAAATSVQSVPWLDKPLSSVRSADVQQWVAAELKRGLAPSTIKTRLNYVQMSFRAAAGDRRIVSSPAVGVKAPRARRTDASMRVLSAEEVSRVLAAAGHFRPFVEACVFAGLRLGEAAGLQLRDVDVPNRTIAVARQIQGASSKTATLVAPKFGSERTIYVPTEYVTLLSTFIATQQITGHDEHLFTTELGRTYNRNSAGHAWRRVREQVGLADNVTLHTLRHTFASNLIAQGCDVVTVQRALGHSTPSITLNVYSHVWPSAEDKTRGATATFMMQVARSAD